jgi:dipeptidyl aminopeptidase/acylaminoacyl peptidase
MNPFEMKKSTLTLIVIIITFLISTNHNAQENVIYQKPPKEILELVDVELAPRTFFDSENKVMLLAYRDAYKSIEELSIKELRLGGLRIDPKTFIGSRTRYYNNVKVNFIEGKPKVVEVLGLPKNPRLANFNWSPDERKVAFTNTTTKGVEVWVLDVERCEVKRITDANVNANLGDVINWFKDSEHLLVKMKSSNAEPLIDGDNQIPTGPTVSVNNGKKAQNRTYQDLLKNKTDEHNFEQLALSDLYKVNLAGEMAPWLANDMFRNVSFSPDGEFVMVKTIARPFSYIVPYYRFASKTIIYNKDGSMIKIIADDPLVEDMPKGFMSTVNYKRSFQWRADKASSLVYVKALDGGDANNEVEFRDEVFELNHPFEGDGKSMVKTINRYSGISWSTDEVAFLFDYWWNTRNTKTYTFNPSKLGDDPQIIFDRNYQDKYNDPGDLVMVKNEYGRNIVHQKEGVVSLISDGFTKEGQFPTLYTMNVSSGKKETLYKSKMVDKLENIIRYIPKSGQVITRIESPNEYPNYYIKKLKSKKLSALTTFKNPFKGLEYVHKEVITYKREDGIELSGTLYLPLGYDKEKKEKVPLIMWAYPVEYKDKTTAGQNTQNANQFTYPYYGSPVYWVTKGYAVLDDAAFPIIGEEDEEPNDSFRKQLVANAEAGINAVDKLGYIDKSRVAIGGHSYGAFMVANLLSHSDLFAAGIARSGAYNRTLTPFGFQSEERSYWEAPEIYYKMSPFMHADKMKHPLLLIHGEVDNNSGTYPLQSQRYFNALKGLGATVRLVFLPKESHGYRAKESILHVLWEQDQWLDKYVMNKK